MRAAGIAGPDLDARLLVGAACGLDHAALIRDGGLVLDGAVDERLRAMVARRLAHEPVSRILGRREFWGLALRIGPDVLDPRPETEGVVAAVLDGLKGREGEPLRILDLGTGSGAILAALLREFPNGFGIGVERSAAACRVAATNLAVLDLGRRAALVRGSWADPLSARFDVVVSNPPYIRSDAIAGLAADVRNYDPLAALDGGPDGLDAFRSLLPRLAALLEPGGIAALECGWDQAESVASMLKPSGFRDVATVLDLAGHGRVIVVRA